MNVLSIISLTCFIIVMLIGLLFAGMYLFRKKFMPYHVDAVGKSWNELDREIRVLIIALMRVVGGGWLASSMAMGIFLYLLFLKGIELSAMALCLTGLAVTIPTLIATLIVRTRSNGHPPAGAAILAIVLLLAGTALYFIPA
jgi:hypothetical protein